MVVCWFDERGLHGNVKAKIKAYNRDKLIKPLGVGLYELKALKGNKRLQTVFINGFIKSCTCQAFQREGKVCSHILAVEYYEDHKEGLIE